MMLSRTGLWSVQHDSCAWCLGVIGLRLDYKTSCAPPVASLHPSRIAAFTFARSPRSNVTSVSCPAVANAAR